MIVNLLQYYILLIFMTCTRNINFALLYLFEINSTLKEDVFSIQRNEQFGIIFIVYEIFIDIKYINYFENELQYNFYRFYLFIFL